MQIQLIKLLKILKTKEKWLLGSKNERFCSCYLVILYTIRSIGYVFLLTRSNRKEREKVHGHEEVVMA
jgi:hypothetical protein